MTAQHAGMCTPRCLALLAFVALSCQGATITIDASAGLAGNAVALSAFQRAAARWGAILLDDVGVVIAGDLQPLAAGTLGQATTQFGAASYETVRGGVVADAADEPDDAVVASLPASAPVISLPAGFSHNGQLWGTTANLRAMGFLTPWVTTDATITFSSNYSFDFDNSDGVTAGTIDFETVALHEIGHVLGFVSAADYVDVNFSNPQAVPMYALDLFRFGSPATASEIQNGTRELTPGQIAYFSDGSQSYLMSTGRLHGDGRQASHWKDGSLTGIMVPALGAGQVLGLSGADLRALDVIGWEINSVPEPSTWAISATGLLALAWLRRRSA